MSKDTAPAITEELGRVELDRLAAEHDADLATAGADTFQPGEAAPVAGEMSNTECVAMALEMAAGIGANFYPSLKETASSEKCLPVAKSVGAVLDKYGVKGNSWLDHYGPEIMAAASCFGLGAGVYAGIKADIAAREAAERRQPAPSAPPVPVTGETPPEAGADLPTWSQVNDAARV